MSLSTPAVILAQIITSSSPNPWSPSYRSALLKYFSLLNFFSCVWFLYLSGMKFLAGFTLSGFGMARPCCCNFILPHPYPTILLVISCHIDCDFFIQCNGLIPPLLVAFCWYIGRTTRYQAPPLFTCRMSSWPCFSSTRFFSPLWLTRKRPTLFANSWFHVSVTLSLPSLKLFQNVTVDDCNVDWTQWNKGWSIILWSSCFQACYNNFDTRLCALRVVLKWEYECFTILFIFKRSPLTT